MNTQTEPQKDTTVVWILAGCALGTALAVWVLPAWIPALTASITEGTAYWLLARIGGFVAYGLLWLSVVFGLLMTGKIARHWPGAPQANAIHQSVSVLALIYTAFHAMILLGDRYINFDLKSILVPFSTVAYEPFWVGVGQVSAYLLVILALSFYVRKYIGMKTWRALHYLSFILYLLVTLHALLAGTDTQKPWALMFYLGSGLITSVLLMYRILSTMRARSSMPKENHVRIPESYADHALAD